ncbi:hypothetical protein GCM10010123_32530 [Pilimelia anulata]|uniref:NAD(P)-binding domain-containing protein n=1 Tax=Pilimelia anulata TaxID=53371 RepID=A0A8J3BAP5_9ACTN|nr:NAD(P)H-binding protein [Pilimelia anulata]GGK00132.1 hypothetical protein GCM10010123_32530 [Pilimelia anulata]
MELRRARLVEPDGPRRAPHRQGRDRPPDLGGRQHLAERVHPATLPRRRGDDRTSFGDRWAWYVSPGRWKLDAQRARGSDPGTLAGALRGVRRAYLILPQGTTRPATRIGEFLDAAAGTGLRRVVLLSAYGVDGAEGSGLREAEKLVEGSALDWTILRPNWFLQNFSAGFFLPPILAAGTVPVPAGDGAVSFVDTRDIAAIAAEALTADGHAGRGYPITGPAAVTFADAAAAISAAAGRPVRYVATDPAETRAALLAGGVSAEYADLLLLLYAGIRAGHSAPVTDTVERLLGRPARDLAAFAAEHAATWRG